MPIFSHGKLSLWPGLKAFPKFFFIEFTALCDGFLCCVVILNLHSQTCRDLHVIPDDDDDTNDLSSASANISICPFCHQSYPNTELEAQQVPIYFLLLMNPFICSFIHQFIYLSLRTNSQHYDGCEEYRVVTQERQASLDVMCNICFETILMTRGGSEAKYVDTSYVVHVITIYSLV
jgi:ribosomal protein S27E